MFSLALCGGNHRSEVQAQPNSLKNRKKPVFLENE